jgi:SOS-response transcriptional repressor LexA
MKWYEKAKKLMKQKGIKQDDLISIFGVTTRGAVGHYLTGRRQPDPDQIAALALKLGCKIDDLFSVEGVIHGQLEGPSGCMEAKSEYKPNTTAGPNIRGNVPLISWVKAGQWCEAIDLYNVGDAEDWLPCPVSHGPHTYCLRVSGDSMTNTIPGQKSYPEGTIIFVDPDRPVTIGCRVIAKIPGANEATFKEYRVDGGKRYLKPLNQQYQMQEISDDVIICGVVIFSGLPE